MDALAPDYPGLALHGVVGDFTRHLDRLPRGAPAHGRVPRRHRSATCAPATGPRSSPRCARVLRPGERLLLGTSMVIDAPTMVAAYDDAQGVTAAFNRNVLRVLNRELVGRLRRRRVRPPRAVGPRHEWIEMRLRARRAMTVRVADLDLDRAASPRGRSSPPRPRRSSGPAGCGGGWRPPATRSPAPGPTRGRHALTLATAAVKPPSGGGGHPVQEAQHARDLSGVVEGDDVETDDRGLPGRVRAERPGEAGLAVVAVDRPGEPERPARELLLGAPDQLGDRGAAGDVGERVGVGRVRRERGGDGLRAVGVAGVPCGDVGVGDGRRKLSCPETPRAEVMGSITSQVVVPRAGGTASVRS